jgi:hypothetical protein
MDENSTAASMKDVWPEKEAGDYMQRSFEADIPSILARTLNGGTMRAGCGSHLIERMNDGGVRLSATTFRWLVARLGNEQIAERK